jgi:hypothetical protein
MSAIDSYGLPIKARIDSTRPRLMECFMHEDLTRSIRGLHLSKRGRLEDECDALLERIQQARKEGAVTDEQATQLVYDVRNERSRCFRATGRGIIR